MNRVSSPDQHARERADALCREMVELTAHISAAEARFFELLADFDRNEYWRCLGCHSAAQWLTWQCGFGDVAARERVRVARALEKLPQISAAFRRGAISYSKVRELTRAAQPETENALLHVALHGTAAHVQRVVAQHCRAEQLSASAEAISQFRRRYVRYRYDDDGMVLIEARLPVEVGEVVIRAIDAAVEVLYREAASGSPAGADSNQIETKRDVPAGTPTNGSVGGKEADDNVEAAAEVPAETLAAAELDRGPTVRSIEAQADVPAETRSRDRIERARRLDQKASTPGIESPDVSAGTDGGRLSLIGIGPVDQGSPGASGLAQSSDEASDTQTELEPLAARRADGLRLLADSFLSAPTAGRVDTSADRYQVVVHIDQALLCGAVKSCLASGESNSTSCELDDGRALAVETARRLACDATLVGIVEDENGEPLNVGRRTRAISPALRRALRARDGGCRFPGCGRSRFTHAHHVVHWANGGETSLKNLITLCTFHHALVHEGGYSIRRLEDGSFAFFSPEGERLPGTGRLDPGTAEVLIRAADQGQVTLRELGLGGARFDWLAGAGAAGRGETAH